MTTARYHAHRVQVYSIICCIDPLLLRQVLYFSEEDAAWRIISRNRPPVAVGLKPETQVWLYLRRECENCDHVLKGGCQFQSRIPAHADPHHYLGPPGGKSIELNRDRLEGLGVP